MSRGVAARGCNFRSRPMALPLSARRRCYEELLQSNEAAVTNASNDSNANAHEKAKADAEAKLRNWRLEFKAGEACVLY